MIRERGELLLQLVEQLHDSDVRAVALPHRGPPSSWQGLPAGARYIIVTCRRSSLRRTDTRWSVASGSLTLSLSFSLIYVNNGRCAPRGIRRPVSRNTRRNTGAMKDEPRALVITRSGSLPRNVDIL